MTILTTPAVRAVLRVARDRTRFPARNRSHSPAAGR